MSWHQALLTVEQAALWTFTGGLVARLLVRKPLRVLLHWLVAQAVHQAQIADSLKTDTPGGLREVRDMLAALAAQQAKISGEGRQTGPQG